MPRHTLVRCVAVTVLSNVTNRATRDICIGRCANSPPKKMEFVVKQFNELSAQELFEIYKLRVSVFVVDQSCPYQEVDDADKAAYHLVLRDEDGIPHIKMTLK